MPVFRPIIKQREDTQAFRSHERFGTDDGHAQTFFSEVFTHLFRFDFGDSVRTYALFLIVFK